MASQSQGGPVGASMAPNRATWTYVYLLVTVFDGALYNLPLSMRAFHRSSKVASYESSVYASSSSPMLAGILDINNPHLHYIHGATAQSRAGHTELQVTNKQPCTRHVENC